MKKIFFKTIALILILSSFSVLSGSCAGIWLKKAQASSLNVQKVLMGESCSDYETVVSLNKQAFSLSPYSQPAHHDNNLMPCCEDDNDSTNTLAANKKFEFSNLPLNLVSLDPYTFTIASKLNLPVLPILSPPEQMTISTTNIRI